MKLFCFPHAGGSVRSFAGWQRQVGTGAEVVAVPYPRRDDPTVDFERLVDHCDLVIGEQADDHVFYGHSMGARVAYAVTARRERRGTLPPRSLAVGAAAPPSSSLWSRPASAVRDALAVDPSRAGSPSGAAAARLSHDLRICLTPGTTTGAVRTSLLVLCGARDPVVPLSSIHGWARHAAGTLRIEVLDGGHFFAWDDPEKFWEVLGSALSDASPGIHQRPDPWSIYERGVAPSVA